MALPALPANLPELVKDKFEAARATGELTFWPTDVAILYVNDISFQLRFCPALAKKPKPSKPQDGKKPLDPFLEPPEALRIVEIGSPPSHVLVLNKFAIVPEHFILATNTYKKQTHLLEESDLNATLACLQAWRARGKELFAFFNSGEYSGASQPHRHIQFLPVESMMEGIKDGEWQPLVDKLASSPIKSDIPFTYFAELIPTNPSAGQLYALYISLYKKACHAVDFYLLDNPEEQLKMPADEVGSSAISYNLGMTDSSIVLIPRRAEGLVISPPGEEPKNTKPVALNGTVLAGTLLVKNKFEWTTLKNDKTKLPAVLKAIAIPRLAVADTNLGTITSRLV